MNFDSYGGIKEVTRLLLLQRKPAPVSEEGDKVSDEIKPADKPKRRPLGWSTEGLAE